jgi:hypothetical protein
MGPDGIPIEAWSLGNIDMANQVVQPYLLVEQNKMSGEWTSIRDIFKVVLITRELS